MPRSVRLGIGTVRRDHVPGELRIERRAFGFRQEVLPFRIFLLDFVEDIEAHWMDDKAVVVVEVERRTIAMPAIAQVPILVLVMAKSILMGSQSGCLA